MGALHGSAKTEEVELMLIKDLVYNHGVKFYFPETDFSTANHFQKYIESGDQVLLKDLIHEYGTRVPQERSIEVLEKWKLIRDLFRENDVQVLGIDKIASYKYSVKELLSLIEEGKQWSYKDSLEVLLAKDRLDWQAYYPSKVRSVLVDFIEDYENNEAEYKRLIGDTITFDYIIKNIKYTFERKDREQVIYDNYSVFFSNIDIKNEVQFFRFGVFHIMKSRISSSASFFTSLIESELYQADEVMTIQGFLTKSKVLWDVKHNKNHEYVGYTVKGGYGIGDYFFEHYQGIRALKKNKVSDLTLFKLKEKGSPYFVEGNHDLVGITRLSGSPFWIPEQEKCTLDYIDCAILISDSKANTPLEEIESVSN